MPLQPIEAPFSPLELAQKINDNFASLDAAKADSTALANYVPTSQKGTASGVATLNASSEVVQKAQTAGQADNYNPSSGTIKTKYDAVDSGIANIKSGNTIVGKARTIEAAAHPGNSKYFGTSPSGAYGFYDVPQPGEAVTGLHTEPFTATDSRWGAPVSGVYTLTVPHSNGYPIAVFKEDGAVHTQVMVDIQRDNTNAYIRAMTKFGGYIVMG